MENLEDHAGGRKELLKVPEQKSIMGKPQNDDLPQPGWKISWKRRQMTPGRRLGINCNSLGKSNNKDLDQGYSMENGKKETQMGAVCSPFSPFWPSNTTPTKHWRLSNTSKAMFFMTLSMSTPTLQLLTVWPPCPQSKISMPLCSLWDLCPPASQSMLWNDIELPAKVHP